MVVRGARLTEHTEQDLHRLLISKQLKRTFVFVKALSVILIVGLVLGVPYYAGRKLGQAEGYAAGYSSGQTSKAQEISELVEKQVSTMAPISIPDESDCSTLILLAARAGELKCAEQVSYLFH
jgi:asparagine N-glycosylation enzyme membrane subunit Stt3